jgi:Secretion system C-terminal sorting domain
MKILAYLLLLLTLPCVAQQPFYWPFEAGDRVVIGDHLMRFDKPDQFSEFNYDSVFKIKCRMLMHPLDFDIFDVVSSNWYHQYKVGVTVSGIFAAESHNTLVELFPNSPPISDTLWLARKRKLSLPMAIYRYCTNVREYDTIVSGEAVRAFSADIYELDDTHVYRYTLAENYWVIKVEKSDGSSSSLKRYKIGTKQKDIGPYEFRFPSLCKDIQYEYQSTMSSELPPFWERKDTKTSVRDTVINDTIYFLGLPRLFAGINTWRPTRMEGTNIFIRIGDMEVAVVPPTLLLGDSVVPGVISGDWFVAIDSIDYNGMHNTYKFLFEEPGSVDTYSGEVVYCSDIGFWSNNYGDGVKGYTTTLTTFTPCPPVPDGIEPPIPTIPEWHSVVYPSPASDKVTITIKRAASTTPLSGNLQVSDELGRTYLTREWKEIAQDSSLTIPVKDFAPGKYFYRLTTRKGWMKGSFVVQR